MKFFKTFVKPAFELIGSHHRRKGLLLIPLLLIQSLADVLSVASFAPMALIILRPESIRENLFLKNIYEEFSFTDQRTFILAWSLSIAIFFLLKHGLGILITRFKSTYAFEVAATLSKQGMEDFLGQSFGQYHHLKSGKEQLKIAQLPISFANNILLGLANLITETVILVVLAVTLIFYDWHSVFFLIILFVPAAFFYRRSQKKLDAINHSLFTDHPEMIRHIHQLIENFVEINLYQKKDHFVKEINRLNQRIYQSHVTQAVLQANSFRLFETTAALGLCLLVLYSTLAGFSPDRTVMLLGLYTAAGFRAVPSFNRIFVALLQMRANEHVFTGLKAYRPARTPTDPDLPLTFESTLDLCGISFSFPDRPPVFQKVDLQIRKGQKIALTGPSGSGKTSLLFVIMRFLKESEGEILIDGVPLTASHVSAWQKKIAYVSQNPVMLDSSLAENIAFGYDTPSIDHEKIKTILQSLDLGSWLSGLPDGLMTRFGEHGVQLSGGQRQRIAIARAIYHDAEIFLMDEPTSQVDAVTEIEIHAVLKHLSNQKKTLIMITHRTSYLHFFDKVFNLISGELIERPVPLEH